MSQFIAGLSAFAASRRAVLGFLGTLPFLKFATNQAEADQHARQPGAKESVFQVDPRPDGRGFQAQFFRDGKRMARADLSRDTSVADVNSLSDRWLAAFG